ncbi:DUF4194 domain-containing protein [Raineyella sp. LH-20]|uniref:DUF4194 domain-containing protein n=1 Tax=Raineyella sp. LH-20 TaxID=3081204 RepID=UPI0029533A14|nr:DUF4194 domain-containing protein [Raineyella sp. LH-20]WOP19107.1 DUF4194 domain-containing protein [Raineyella sp. LH-20]
MSDPQTEDAFGSRSGAYAEDAFGTAADPEVLPDPARRSMATLLTSRFITRASHAAAWQGLIDHEPRIRARLADMFLELVIDHDHEVAFKRQVDDPEAPVVLRREKPLGKDATLLLVHLRQLHAFTDAADSAVAITLSEATDFLARFRDPSDTDEAGFQRDVETALRGVERLGLLRPDQDVPDTWIVSPAVVALVTPDRLAAIRDQLQVLAGGGPAANGERSAYGRPTDAGRPEEGSPDQDGPDVGASYGEDDTDQNGVEDDMDPAEDGADA